MSEPKTAVPKFASFKPKSTPPLPRESEERRNKSKSKDESGARDHRKRRHHRHRSRSHERGHRTKPIYEEPALPPSPSRDEPSEVFVIDLKGDVNNLVYGSIHRYNIPTFRRFGAGSVLGAPPNTKIDRTYGDDRAIILSNQTHSRVKFREKYIFSKIEREKPRLLKIRHDVELEPPVSYEVDFLPLRAGRGRKRKRDNSSGSEVDEINYRSIHGKAKGNSQPIDDELQYATESDPSGSETGRAMKLDELTKQQTVELSRAVEQYPHDIEAWISLIDHQDTLVGANDDHHRITSAEMRSTADIKIHMYEKALEKARSLPDRERLLLGLMREGSKFWEIKYQSDRWEEISRDNIDSLLLWKNFLDFKQTTFLTFRFEEVKEVFSKRIKLLSAAIKSAGPDESEPLYQQLLYVLLRFTIYVRESGYSELATAIWQGVLEFNIFAPQSISQAEKTIIFRDFWDSEVPRIGEENAHGWSNFVANPGSSEPPEPSTDEEEDLLSTRNVFECWAKSERSRSQASRTPARTMDEVAEDDPFRVILVSDIEEFLVSLPQNSANLRICLINAFFLFCRLPPFEVPGEEYSECWSLDTFINGAFLESARIQERLSTTKDAYEGTESDISSIFGTTAARFKNSSESMFSNSWFKSLESWQEYYAGDNGPVSYKFIRASLHQLVQIPFNEALSEYYLSFEWRNEPNTIKKASKTLLKRQPSSLKLYNAYGIIEWSRGNKEAANGVFSAALIMSKSMAESERKDSILLWKSWIWASLEDIDNDASLRRILSIPDGILNEFNPSPAAFLKAKQHLMSNRDYLLSSGDARYAVIYAECLAILEYLSSKSVSETQSRVQGNISAALLSVSNFSRILKDRGLEASSSHELFLQAAARLLYHHARIGPFRPALLRSHLTIYVNLFPQNTIFLSLYTFNESRLRIDNRVRAILLDMVITPQNDILTSRLFAIQYEISYGTIHSVRSAFENALSSPATKSSTGLWRFYILYCLKTPEFHSQIKNVWYRALRACPWAKELYTLGFETLEQLVDFGELKATWRIMGEKELRVHVDLTSVPVL